jgi:hypothetical protein
MHDTSQDCDDVRSYQGSADTPVQPVHLLDFFGSNGMPDMLFKEGMKQPDQIKISFKKGTKEITGHVATDQAQFVPEYFLVFTLLDFKSKIFT